MTACSGRLCVEHVTAPSTSKASSIMNFAISVLRHWQLHLCNRSPTQEVGHGEKRERIGMTIVASTGLSVTNLLSENAACRFHKARKENLTVLPIANLVCHPRCSCPTRIYKPSMEFKLFYYIYIL